MNSILTTELNEAVDYIPALGTKNNLSLSIVRTSEH